MKIITWNCNMAFRKKAGFILVHKPDILVVPECEHPGRLVFAPGIPAPTSMLWFGDNRHKGLGVFAYGHFKLKLLQNHNPQFKTIVPVRVSGGRHPFTLYAVWAHNPNDPDGRYIEQVWKALLHYDDQLTGKRVVLAGDFNSNTIWDRKYRIGNHSHVVEKLAGKGIYSAYHLYHKQQQGSEQHPTLYMYRHKDKPYHIDYCFLSKDLSAKMQSVEIGEHGQWSQYSDHVPVIVTLDFDKGKK
jgi:exonuclease III